MPRWRRSGARTFSWPNVSELRHRHLVEGMRPDIQMHRHYVVFSLAQCEYMYEVGRARCLGGSLHYVCCTKYFVPSYGLPRSYA